MKGLNVMEEKEVIKQFIIENLCLDSSIKDITDDELLLEKGIIDSVGVLFMIAFLDERFKISIPDEELTGENFESLNKIVSFVLRRMAAG